MFVVIILKVESVIESLNELLLYMICVVINVKSNVGV